MNYTEYTIPSGAVGVWEVPKRKISVPCYKAKQYSKRQSVVDEKLSALYAVEKGATFVYDHARSGNMDGMPTWMMNCCELDDDAYFLTADKVTHYRCYRLERAKALSWGWTINGKVTKPMSSKDMVCVSCTDDTGEENYLAYFAYCEAENR